MTPKTPGPKLSKLDRLLVGPPPRPRPHWDFYAEVEGLWDGVSSIPPWPERKHKREGITVLYGGSTNWSQLHHLYHLWPRRDLLKLAKLDVVAAVIAVARRLEVEFHRISCRLSGIETPPTPSGLCRGCWQSDLKRVAGRPHVEQVNDHCPRLLDLCERHARQWGMSRWLPIEGGVR